MIDYALNFVIIFHSMFVIKEPIVSPKKKKIKKNKEPIKINVSNVIFHITYKMK